MNFIPRPPRSPGSRRSFKLSPLEMLVLGLIVVVVLYLVSLWLSGAFKSPRQASPPPSAPAQLLDRALAATEKVQARLLSMEKKLNSLEQRLDRLGSARGRGKAAPNRKLLARVSALEKKVAKLAAAGPAQPVDLTPLEARLLFLEKKVGEKPVKESLDQRLAKLEKRLAQLAKVQPGAKPPELGKLDKRLAALEKKLATAGGEARAVRSLAGRVKALEKMAKQVEPSEAHTAASLADLETRVQNLERSAPKAGAAAGVAAASLALMETRLQKIEATLAKTTESLHKVRAPVSDPELSLRLERLEKASAAASRAASRKQAARLRELDKRLKEISQRLGALALAQKRNAARLAKLGRQASQASAPPPPRVTRPSPRPASKPAPKARLVTHTVRRGQTLYGLARRYGVKVDDIRRWNPKLQNRRHLWVNEKLTIYTTK